MRTRVAILGCGPAALIAAEACMAGPSPANVEILSMKQKSIMPGAQFLHAAIPGVSSYEPDNYIRLEKRGDASGYARKVYGDPEHPVSWNNYEEGYIPAWSLAHAYDKMWERWEEGITDTRLDGSYIRLHAKRYDLIFSTIPARALCRGGCKFQSAKVWFTSRSSGDCQPNSIIYNGDPRDPWYRTSHLFGHTSTEYSHEPQGKNCWEGFKPTYTNCNCAPKNVVRLGRFGKWNKSVLLHHVYPEAQHALLAVQ